MKIFSLGLALFLISGCSSYGVIDNKPQTASSAEQGYSFNTAGERGAGDVALILALSGGGTRAAALAYGVMPELRDTSLVIDASRAECWMRWTPSARSRVAALPLPTMVCSGSVFLRTSKRYS